MKDEYLKKLDKIAALAKKAKYCALFLPEEDAEKAFVELMTYCEQVAKGKHYE